MDTFLVFKYFDRAKKEMLKELEKHPVTKDLENSIDSGLVTKGDFIRLLGLRKRREPRGRTKKAFSKKVVR